MRLTFNLSSSGDGGRRSPRTALASCLALSVLVAGCHGDTPTSPTSTDTTSTTTTVASPTITEEFAGTVGVGGASFYSFAVTTNGTVNITLTSVGGASVPSSVWLGLGLGVPSGEDCAASTTVNTQAGAAAQITGTYAPGTYCARVYDIGNLVAPARFTVSIAYP